MRIQLDDELLIRFPKAIQDTHANLNKGVCVCVKSKVQEEILQHVGGAYLPLQAVSVALC